MKQHLTDRVHIQLVGGIAARQFFAPFFFAREKEVLHAAFLDSELRLVSLISVAGTSNEVELSVSEVLREAVKQDAHAVLLAHNHPSGQPQPSRADQALTRQVASVCEHMGIILVDHLIFGDGEPYSFREKGVLADY